MRAPASVKRIFFVFLFLKRTNLAFLVFHSLASSLERGNVLNLIRDTIQLRPNRQTVPIVESTRVSATTTAIPKCGMLMPFIVHHHRVRLQLRCSLVLRQEGGYYVRGVQLGMLGSCCFGHRESYCSSTDGRIDGWGRFIISGLGCVRLDCCSSSDIHTKKGGKKNSRVDGRV